MARIPEPQQTPDGPVFEGRPLDRPEEEVVDQGAGFDLRTLVNRRTVLSLVGAGIGAIALAACAPTTTPGATDGDGLPSGEIPDETAGPYPADGSNDVNGETVDVLEESGIVRRDIRSSIAGGDAVAGVALTFSLTITDLAAGDVPFENVAVYAWHCDAQGRYSMYSDGVQDQTWLRGVQVADANGRVTFTSVMPGCYLGRWTHIHFEVYPDLDSITDSGNAIATSQMAFPQDVLDTVYQRGEYSGSAANLAQISLDSDNVFGEDGGALQMATVSGDAESGYLASLVARVDTTTEPTGGGAPGGGTPGQGGGPGAPPSQ